MAEITIIPAKNQPLEIVRTAAYARVSSDSEDQLNSFAAQIRYYTELLKNSTDAVLVDMYADEGITGTSAAKRPDFQRLMSDCRKGKIDRILTKSVSRFARNTTECLAAVRELKALGISVYFEKEDIETAEISTEMLLTLYSQFAQEESISISKNVRMGVHKQMADGTYKNPSVPYGFAYDNGKIIPVEEKAETVQQIFKWYVDGIGAEEISVRLNRINIPAPYGKCWRTNQILRILTNEKYVGDTLLQKRFTTDALPFRLVENRGEKPKFYIRETHEPIVQREIFDKVQSLLKSRKPNFDCTLQKSVFSGKIKCGRCGGTFRRKKNREKIYWVCRNHDHKRFTECEIRQIGEWVFQAAFVRLWNKLQAHYTAILAPMLRQFEMLYEREKSGDFQLANLRKDIAEIKQQIHLLTVLNSQGTLDDAYFKSRSQELDRKLMTAQKQLRASLDDEKNEQLDELRKLIAILEKSEPITEFDEIKFGQIVSKITVLSESEIRFGLIGRIGFTEPIER